MSDPSFTQLLGGACARGGAIAHEAHRLAMAFGIDPVERVLVSRSRFLAKLECPRSVHFLGRRDREAMSRAEYWRLLDGSHYFLAGRIETPRAAGASPLEVIGPSL